MDLFGCASIQGMRAFGNEGVPSYSFCRHFGYYVSMSIATLMDPNIGPLKRENYPSYTEASARESPRQTQPKESQGADGWGDGFVPAQDLRCRIKGLGFWGFGVEILGFKGLGLRV